MHCLYHQLLGLCLREGGKGGDVRFAGIPPLRICDSAQSNSSQGTSVVIWGWTGRKIWARWGRWAPLTWPATYTFLSMLLLIFLSDPSPIIVLYPFQQMTNCRLVVLHPGTFSQFWRKKNETKVSHFGGNFSVLTEFLSCVRKLIGADRYWRKIDWNLRASPGTIYRLPGTFTFLQAKSTLGTNWLTDWLFMV